MSTYPYVKKIRAAIELVFPAFLHWSRLPGLISWAAVSAGTGLAFLVPFNVSAALSCRHSAGWFNAAMFLAAALLAAGILVRKRVIRFAAFLCFAFLMCCVHRAKQIDVYEGLRPDAAGGRTMVVAGKVCSAPLPYYENFHFLLRVDSVEGAAQKLRGITLDCICPYEPPQYGSVVVRGIFSPPKVRRNPFEYDEFTAKMAQGVWGSLTASSCETVSTRRTLLERIAVGARGITVAALRKVKNFDNRALLQASFLGDTEYLSPFVKTAFRRSGIYHLIAISGLNTAMLMAALYFFLRLFPIGRTATHLICVALLWAYLPFVGMIPSLFRATIMATLIIAALLLEKKNYALHTLGLAGTLWLILSPESLFGPGYQLSFAATAGLFLLFPVLDRFTPKPPNAIAGKIVSFLFSSLFISIASFLATAPILLYHFGTISYFGLVANLFAVSAMTVAMWAFFAGLFLQAVLPFSAAIPLWVAERFLDAIVWTGNLANHVSWSQVSYPSPWPEMIVVVAIVLAGFAAVNRESLKRYFLFCMLGMALFMPADYCFRALRPGFEAVRFAIPRAPAMGIRWPGGRVWLIVADAKHATPWVLKTSVVPWLRHTGKSRFDALLLPSEDPGDTAALKQGVPAFADVSLLSFSPLQKSLYFPGDQCACTVVRSDTGTGIIIDARGAKAAIELQGGGKRPGHGRNNGDLSTPDRSIGALVYRSRGKTIFTSEVVPADHPLR